MSRLCLSWLERVCWAVALGCCSYALFAYWMGHSVPVIAAPSRAGAVARAPEPGNRATSASAGPVLGRMSIPALKLSVAILNQDDSDSLLRGVGHIDGTALPGGLGTVGLAGHRDTFLRPLRNIARGMEIRVSGADGTYRYVTDRTEIVKPEQVSVLATKNVPELVLVTCYPFYYVGSAPMRFIVHAHLVSLVPE